MPSPASSGSALCAWTLPPSPAPCSGLPCLTEGSRMGQAQVGIWVSGHAFQTARISRYLHHSSWPNNQFSDPSESKTGSGMLWMVRCSQQSISKASGPHTLSRAVPYTEEALSQELFFSPMLLERLLWPPLDISGTICRITAHGRVTSSKTWLEKNYQVLPTQNSLECPHSCEHGFTSGSRLHFWFREGLPKDCSAIWGTCEFKAHPWT